MKIKETEIARICTGTRKILNTDWPIETVAKRLQEEGKAPYWLVTYNVCNGIPDGSKRFATRTEALAELE